MRGGGWEGVRMGWEGGGKDWECLLPSRTLRSTTTPGTPRPSDYAWSGGGGTAWPPSLQKSKIQGCYIDSPGCAGNLAPAQPGVAPGIVGVKTPCRKRTDSDWHPRDDRLRGKAGTMRVGAPLG